jgi:hypothetical protein
MVHGGTQKILKISSDMKPPPAAVKSDVRKLNKII